MVGVSGVESCFFARALESLRCNGSGTSGGAQVQALASARSFLGGNRCCKECFSRHENVVVTEEHMYLERTARWSESKAFQVEEASTIRTAIHLIMHP